jgi:hypothetical protein
VMPKAPTFPGAFGWTKPVAGERGAVVVGLRGVGVQRFRESRWPQLWIDGAPHLVDIATAVMASTREIGTAMSGGNEAVGTPNDRVCLHFESSANAGFVVRWRHTDTTAATRPV